MSTNSYIGFQREDGKIEAVYCHWDGYLRHNGRILIESYDGRDRAKALVRMGNISSLRKEIGEKHPFDTYHLKPEEKDPRWDDWTIFYGRDRGEKGVETVVYSNLREFEDETGGYYVYLHTIEAGWRVRMPGSRFWVGLRRAVEKAMEKAYWE